MSPFEYPTMAGRELFYLEYLHRIDTLLLEPQMLQKLGQDKFEVCGFPKAQGMYVSIEHFPANKSLAHITPRLKQ
jgi:hypothetical protein